MIISNFYVLTKEYHLACIVKGTSMETKFFMCKHVVIKAEYFDSDRLVSVCM